jgi:hypothetical protein
VFPEIFLSNWLDNTLDKLTIDCSVFLNNILAP